MTNTTTPPRAVQGVLQEYKDLQDIIAILGMEELSEEDLLKAELPEEVDAALDLAKTAETRINLS